MLILKIILYYISILLIILPFATIIFNPRKEIIKGDKSNGYPYTLMRSLLVLGVLLLALSIYITIK